MHLHSQKYSSIMKCDQDCNEIAAKSFLMVETFVTYLRRCARSLAVSSTLFSAINSGTFVPFWSLVSSLWCSTSSSSGFLLFLHGIYMKEPEFEYKVLGLKDAMWNCWHAFCGNP